MLEKRAAVGRAECIEPQHDPDFGSGRAAIGGLMEIGFKDGSRTIDQTIAGLLESGFITREEALFHCREKRNFPEPEAPEPKKPKSIWT